MVSIKYTCRVKTKHYFFRTALLLLCAPLISYAQKRAPENWQNLDRKKDKVWGVSTEKAIQLFPAKPKSEPVIVGVIDGGTDVQHEDLKDVLWVNPDEFANNGIDDDGNGYVDDIYGWNFIGGKREDVKDDTYECTRIMAAFRNHPMGADSLPVFKSDSEQVLYTKAKAEYQQNMNEVEVEMKELRAFLDGVGAVLKRTGKENPKPADIDKVEAKTEEEKTMRTIAKYIVITGGFEHSPITAHFREAQADIETRISRNLNLDYNPRSWVGDKSDDLKDSDYGNNHVQAPNADHGTHVAGIIAAKRNNDIGINGVCDQCLILTVRAVPNGDERDKDVANAIRYAVDNGARVINMSFGKQISPNKPEVDEAVKYAMEHDVLLVHAAGNESMNTSETPFFPNALFANSNKANNWIEVGASGWNKKKHRVAFFSNYSSTKVDLFAPGMSIKSTVPGSEYKSFDGTSMAAPVVSGVAGLVRQRFPSLTAQQVKVILMQSATPCSEKLRIPGTGKKCKMKDLCVSGGIVNAEAALKLASEVVAGKATLRND